MGTVIALALRCGLFLHAQVLEAIVQVESGGNPYALAVNGDVELVRQPRSREEATAMARWLAEHGYNFDAGLGQVNSTNLVRLGLDVESVFEPCANLRAASQVLEECYGRALMRWDDEEGAMTAALSCYNTGHFTRGVRNGYVGAVRARLPSSLAPAPIRLAGRASSARARRTEQRSQSETSRDSKAGWPNAAWHREDAFATLLPDAFGRDSHREERIP